MEKSLIYELNAEFKNGSNQVDTFDVDIDGLTIDTGYGDSDCAVVATVDVYYKTTRENVFTAVESISYITIDSCTVYLISKDGEEKEYSSNCDKFDSLIKEEAERLFYERF